MLSINLFESESSHFVMRMLGVKIILKIQSVTNSIRKLLKQQGKENVAHIQCSFNVHEEINPLFSSRKRFCNDSLVYIHTNADGTHNACRVFFKMLLRCYHRGRTDPDGFACVTLRTALSKLRHRHKKCVRQKFSFYPSLPSMNAKLLVFSSPFYCCQNTNVEKQQSFDCAWYCSWYIFIFFTLCCPNGNFFLWEIWVAFFPQEKPAATVALNPTLINTPFFKTPLGKKTTIHFWCVFLTGFEPQNFGSTVTLTDTAVTPPRSMSICIARITFTPHFEKHARGG